MSLQYPGDCATPHETAQWMASVAEGEFGLPGILPVMTSCVELTAAWTGPGCVTDVPGYSYAVDYDSLGWFQQRPSQGWGTVEQLQNAEYALRAFCREAAKLKDHERHAGTTDPDALGRWCQEVQRSAYPDAYRHKGHPMAVELLKEEKPIEYPERKVEFDAAGWAIDAETKEFLRSERKDARLYTNADGWLWGDAEKPPAPVRRPWPQADGEPGWLGDGSYRDLHPTHYSWRADVEEVARYLVGNYDCWVNTYLDHPPGWGLDAVSLDIWGPLGRGDPVNASGDAGFWDIFNNGKPPWVRWCIRDGWIWDDYNGWRAYWDDNPWSDGGHWKHRHYTFW